MTSYLNNGYEILNYFAKFEKFLPHSISIPSFMTVKSQMLELDRGPFGPPPPKYEIGSRDTPYKLGLSCSLVPLTYERLILTGSICSLFSVLSLFAGCFGSCDALIVLLMNFFG